MAQAAQAPTQPDVFSDHYKRLQRIEQSVISAVRVTSDVMQELSRTNQADKEKLRELCAKFLEHVQEAQSLVLEAVKGNVTERSFEASGYYHMVAAMVVTEKLDAVSLHLDGIQRLLRQEEQLELLEEAVQQGDVLLVDAEAEAEVEPAATAEADAGELEAGEAAPAVPPAAAAQPADEAGALAQDQGQEQGALDGPEPMQL